MQKKVGVQESRHHAGGTQLLLDTVERALASLGRSHAILHSITQHTAGQTVRAADVFSMALSDAEVGEIADKFRRTEAASAEKGTVWLSWPVSFGDRR